MALLWLVCLIDLLVWNEALINIMVPSKISSLTGFRHYKSARRQNHFDPPSAMDGITNPAFLSWFTVSTVERNLHSSTTSVDETESFNTNSSENQDIMDWYKKQNLIISSKVSVRTVGKLRGIFSSNKLCGGEVVAAIPPYMIIRSPFLNFEEALFACAHLDDKTRADIKTTLNSLQGDELDKKALLAFRLLELLHQEPEIWQPYKQLCLPARVPNFYSITTRELSKILKENPDAWISENYAQELVESSRREAEDQLPRLLALLEIFAPTVSATSEDLLWAMSIVQSRAVTGVSGKYHGHLNLLN